VTKVKIFTATLAENNYISQSSFLDRTTGHIILTDHTSNRSLVLKALVAQP